ncbi:MAG: iron-containing alcohol dehydrogenase [Eubacteriales bacterium]|nr:iron-containing alcohol dehydrogenase [Eubacteriales bacterium]
MEQWNAVKTNFFGQGALALLTAELKKRKYRRALMVTDSFLYENGTADKVGRHILDAGMEYAIYYEVEANPSVEIVEACTYAAQELEVDVLVAVGGGSSIDTAKAVSILCVNGGRIGDYEGVGKSKKAGIPIIAVNTTAGTGAEVTSFYVITDRAKHSKMCMVDTNCMVEIAVNDTDLMVSMPPALTAATGMDALTHAMEAILTRGATPLTDKDAFWAIRQIKEYLPIAVKDGNHTLARERMAYAQYAAGMAFSNAGLGMVHAMAHAMGGFYNLPHGVCNAVLLPHVLHWNGQHPECASGFAKLAEAFEITARNQKQAVSAVVEAVKHLAGEVGIPPLLNVDLKPGDIEKLAELAMQDTCMPGNCKQPQKEVLVEIYRKILIPR